MQFLAKVDKWRQQTKPRAADTKQLIDLAEQAIRVHERRSDHGTK